MQDTVQCAIKGWIENDRMLGDFYGVLDDMHKRKIDMAGSI